MILRPKDWDEWVLLGARFKYSGPLSVPNDDSVRQFVDADVGTVGVWCLKTESGYILKGNGLFVMDAPDEK